MSIKEPEITGEMLQNYIRRRHADVLAVKQSFSSGDYLNIDMIGHKLKGNGSLFGFPEISEIGAEMEEAAAQADLARVRKVIARFDEAVRQLELSLPT